MRYNSEKENNKEFQCMYSVHIAHSSQHMHALTHSWCAITVTLCVKNKLKFSRHKALPHIQNTCILYTLTLRCVSIVFDLFTLRVSMLGMSMLTKALAKNLLFIMHECIIHNSKHVAKRLSNNSNNSKTADVLAKVIAAMNFIHW